MLTPPPLFAAKPEEREDPLAHGSAVVWPRLAAVGSRLNSGAASRLLSHSGSSSRREP